MSNMDYLTRLKNRNAYQLDMKNRIAAKKEKDTGFILIDLNSLKHINDTMGHETGDRYITCISQAYLNMGPEDGIMYRIGGDEFVVQLDGLGQDQVFRGILAMERAVKAYSDGNVFPAGIAAGYAFFDPGKDVSLESTLARADTYMYRKKHKMKR